MPGGLVSGPCTCGRATRREPGTEARAACGIMCVRCDTRGDAAHYGLELEVHGMNDDKGEETSARLGGLIFYT
jgi:hypothetical protein